MFVYTARGPWMVDMAEMYKQYWSDLGIDVLLKPFGEGVWNKIFVESDWHLAMSQAFGGMKGYPAISRGEIVPIHARSGSRHAGLSGSSPALRKAWSRPLT